MNLKILLNNVKRQRQILEEWKVYERDIENYLCKETGFPFRYDVNGECPLFDLVYQRHFVQLDLTERLLEKALEGVSMDISGTQLQEELKGLKKRTKSVNDREDTDRILQKLARFDFFEKTGYLTDIDVIKLNIMYLERPDSGDSLKEMNLKFQSPGFDRIMLLCFKDQNAATAYKMANMLGSLLDQQANSSFPTA